MMPIFLPMAVGSDSAKKKANMGHDQVLIQSDSHIDVVGDKIAKARRSWFYSRPSQSIQKKLSKEGRFGNAIIFSLVFVVFLLIVGGIVGVVVGVTWNTSLMSMENFSKIVAILSIIFAFLVYNSTTETVDFIRLSGKVGEYTV